LPPFFFAVFFAAFFFVAMLKLLLELTKGTALLPPDRTDPVTRPPGGLPNQSNSSNVWPSQGRDPDGNGHAAAGLRAVLGAGEGTVGAGACTAGAAGAATVLTALVTARFAFPTARFAFATARLAFTRFTARFTLDTARLTFARLTARLTTRLAFLAPCFALPRAADFFFLPAFVAISILPSV
jgi:hypothetical protein